MLEYFGTHITVTGTRQQREAFKKAFSPNLLFPSVPTKTRGIQLKLVIRGKPKNRLPIIESAIKNSGVTRVSIIQVNVKIRER